MDDDSEHLEEILETLQSDLLEDRLTAIRILGEVGNERTLEVLRDRLKEVNQELTALVTAVGKLKRILHVR